VEAVTAGINRTSRVTTRPRAVLIWTPLPRRKYPDRYVDSVSAQEACQGGLRSVFLTPPLVGAATLALPRDTKRAPQPWTTRGEPDVEPLTPSFTQTSPRELVTAAASLGSPGTE